MTRTALLLLVTALAVFFRLYQIDDIPPGLYIDEAQNGLDASAIARGESLPLFIEGGVGVEERSREPMFHYMMAAVFRAFGTTPTSVRVTAAIVGIATVMAFFVLCDRLCGRRMAFYAAMLLAFSRWHVTFSRIGMRAILTPLWFVLVLAALHTLGRRRTVAAAARFGFVLGLGLYTYPAYWVVPIPLVVLLWLGARRGALRDRRRCLALGVSALAAFLLTAGPLIGYAAKKPDHYLARVENLWRPDDLGSGRSEQVRNNLQKVLFMLHFRGDQQARHNIPGTPLLDPVTGLLFLAGLYAMLRTIRTDTAVKLAALLFWLVPLFPSALSNGAPHAMRAVGAMPAVCFIAAGGLETLTRLLQRHATTRRLRLSMMVPAVLLALAGGWSYHEYFRAWARNPAVAHAFSADVSRFFAYCAELTAENDVYLSPYVYHSPSFRFLGLSRQVPFKALDKVAAFAARGGDGRDRIFVTESPQVSFWIRHLYPAAEQIGRYSVYGARSGHIYRVSAGTLRGALTPEELVTSRRYMDDMLARFERQSESW